MEKIKNFFKMAVTGKMMWVTLVTAAVVVAGTTVAVLEITKTKANETLAKANQYSSQEENYESNVTIEDLTDVTGMTEDELKELNEKELEEEEKKEEENKDKDKDKKKKTTQTNSNYYIKVNYGAQIVDVYKKDSNGKYTNRVQTFACSTGTDTPRSGVYRISARYTWLPMYHNVFSNYATRIVGAILFHSVPYAKNYDPSSLLYREYDRLGTKASMGCIRLTSRDAKWIFSNIPNGTQVEFYCNYSEASRRPATQKISKAPAYLRGWDPTDSRAENPWRTYKPEVTPSPSPSPSVSPSVSPSASPLVSPSTSPSVSPEVSPTISPEVPPTESSTPTTEPTPTQTAPVDDSQGGTPTPTTKTDTENNGGNNGENSGENVGGTENPTSEQSSHAEEDQTSVGN